MKLAYMYATPDVTHSQVTAVQGPMGATLAELAAQGYTGAEFLVADPARIPLAELKTAVADAGLDVPAICTGEVYGQDKLSFADPDPNRRRQARDRMAAAMDMAGEFGAMVNIGRLRGRFQPDISERQTLDWIAEAVAQALQANPDVPVVLEPVNHEYANCLMTTAQALEFLRKINLPGFGLMLDAAHMMVEGENIAASIRAAGELFWHFHITDSDRHPVGDGSYDISGIMGAVAASGFAGYTTVETFQIPDADHGIQASYAALQGCGVSWDR